LVYLLRRFRCAIVRKKSTFLENHISTPRGHSCPKFVHTPQNGQVLLVHIPQGMGVSPTFFLQTRVKKNLSKFNIALAIHVYDNALRSGHVTLLQTKFQPLNCPPNRTHGAGRPRVGLCPIFLVFNYNKVIGVFPATK